jgi:hypothetical protein
LRHNESFLRDIQLAAHRRNLVGGILIGAAQNEPLRNGDGKGQKADNDEKPSRSDETPRYSYEWGFVGALAIGIGAALLRLAMELFYKADKAERLSPAAWVVFAAGGAMIVHGLVYACPGTDGLRSLYFL